MYLKSGFKTITAVQLINGLALLNSKAISLRAFRVYLATFSCVAIREAAMRVKRKEGATRHPTTKNFAVSELEAFTGASMREVRHDLKKLEAAGLIAISGQIIRIETARLPEAEKALSLIRSPLRPIPVPRVVL